jgi:hypothetical protein
VGRCGQHLEDRSPEEVDHMGSIIKYIGAALGVLLAAAVIVPLVILAGLFVWLKLTEEADEEALELEQEAGV